MDHPNHLFYSNYYHNPKQIKMQKKKPQDVRLADIFTYVHPHTKELKLCMHITAFCIVIMCLCSMATSLPGISTRGPAAVKSPDISRPTIKPYWYLRLLCAKPGILFMVLWNGHDNNQHLPGSLIQPDYILDQRFPTCGPQEPKCGPAKHNIFKIIIVK